MHVSVALMSSAQPIAPETTEHLRRRARLAMVLAFFMVGFSVIMSWDWKNGGFLGTASATILFAVFLAGITYTAARYARQRPSYFFPASTCASCRRIVPADSILCPYCGQKLR